METGESQPRRGFSSLAQPVRYRNGAIPHTFTRAAFPLGGIGTGNVSLGPCGELRDWELQNQPDKCRGNPYSFFAIHTRTHDDREPVSRVLEARLSGPRDGSDGYEGAEVPGLPRLRASTMRGEYPLVEVQFEDELLPVNVVLSAFTPLIPLDSVDSGIPAAVLRYTVTNPSPMPVVVTIVGSVSHGGSRASGGLGADAPAATVNWRDEEDVRGLDFGLELDPRDRGYGTLSLLTRDQDVTVRPDWWHGLGNEALVSFWDDLEADGRLDPCEPRPIEVADIFEGRDPEEFRPRLKTGSLGITHEVAPDNTVEFEFVLSWCFPNRLRGWDQEGFGIYPRVEVPNPPGTVKNFYATRWPTAWDAGSYVMRELPRLERDTKAFHNALFGSDLETAVLDAMSASVAALRSTTCFRTDDGSFFGWEGCSGDAGCCPGTCTHVWGYAQTVAWLFPDLERTARRIEYLIETEPDGLMRFRTNRALTGTVWPGPAAVDGQMNTLLRLHREWRFSGDMGFLKELWPTAKSTLEFAIREWYRADRGLLEARMHNTYDIEFEGAEPLANILFLAALRAAVKMATHLEDADASLRYSALADEAVRAIEDLLFNGEYYEQRLENAATSRFQYGRGVLSDQLLGQFHAHLNGLGFVLPEEHVRSAIHAVFINNFRADLSEQKTFCRSFAMNDEAGLLLASWPHGGRPKFPFDLNDEVWTGVEYQVATELIYSGLVEEALVIVRSARARHTGEYRNPWNEIECGNHYARAMSAWGLLLAFSGAQYDGVAATLSFDPIHDGTYFFSTDSSWGRATVNGDGIRIALDYGELELSALQLRGRELATRISLVAGETVMYAVKPGGKAAPVSTTAAMER
jgi:D-arabinan exo beta-(1,2)-arabinofuranosidase (non-reducing end)